MLAHTRWASVGIISEANAHPLNHEELGGAGPDAYVAAALNGDVDNYADLKALESLRFPAEITTDAKVIPALVSRRIASGADPIEAFRATVAVVRGVGRDRGADRGAIPAACCSRSGAAGRRCTSASPTTRSSSRASRTASSRSATATSGSTARRCSSPGEPGDAGPDRARSSARGTRASSGGRTTGARCRSTDAELQAARDHDARRRPRRRAALPPEGDLRGARVVPQDAARPASSSDDGRLEVRLPPETLPAGSRRAAARRERCGVSSSSGRAPRAIAARGSRSRCGARSAGRPRHGRGGRRDRALRLRARRRHVATRSSSRSRSRARPPTRTAPSTSCARAARW